MVVTVWFVLGDVLYLLYFSSCMLSVMLCKATDFVYLDNGRFKWTFNGFSYRNGHSFRLLYFR